MSKGLPGFCAAMAAMLIGQPAGAIYDCTFVSGGPGGGGVDDASSSTTSYGYTVSFKGYQAYVGSSRVTWTPAYDPTASYLSLDGNGNALACFNGGKVDGPYPKNRQCAGGDKLTASCFSDSDCPGGTCTLTGDRAHLL